LYEGHAEPNGAIKHSIARAVVVVLDNMSALHNIDQASIDINLESRPLTPKLMLSLQSLNRPCRHIFASLTFCKAAGGHAMFEQAYRYAYYTVKF